MNVFYKLIFIAPLFFLSSCLINRQRQVWLGGLQQTHHADTGSVLRIYFDKLGNLYPDKKQFVPYKMFFDPQNGKKTIAEKTGTGNLETFYITNRSRLHELSSYYKLKGTDFTSAKDSFYAVQKIIRENVIEKLNATGTRNNIQSVIVMIHGFNDTDPTGDYQLMREAIRRNGYDNGGYIYLEIYWDGLTTNQGNPIYENIWGRALQNSAYVSLGLRQILSGIDKSINIRIITHSLGASIGTGAIFNTSTKWQQNGFRKVGKKLKHNYGINYFEKQKTLLTPGNNTRIGMIAPAIPGYNTFIDFTHRNPAIKISEDNIDKVVVGFNMNDFAVTKRFLGKDLARYFGSTSLGCNCERKGVTEFDRAAKILIDSGYSPDMVKRLLRPVDFSLNQRNKKNEEHGLYYYLLHKDCVKDFLKELFD